MASASWSKAEDGRLVALLDEGSTYTAASIVLERTRDAVIQRCRKLGVTVRSQLKGGRPRKAENFQIADFVSIGTRVNTLIVTSVPQAGFWGLSCRFHEGDPVSASTTEILAGAAVCPVCRPVRS